MFGLIGKPLGHSFSQKYFTQKFVEESIDESYELFELDRIEDVIPLVNNYPTLKGFNVTIPYKREIIEFLDSMSEDAGKIGAVNVVKITRDEHGKKISMKGYNSDALGFAKSLEGWLGSDVKSALILGTGGASNAVNYVLKKMGLKTVKVSRRPEEGQYSYSDLTEDVIRENLLIVNTTPLGTFPNSETAAPIPFSFLTSGHYCYDLVYNPSVTRFMRESEKMGAKVKNGLDMLHGQAEAAWAIWNSQDN